MKVFNKFEIGDIVVSLTNINSGTARVKGEMVEVEDDSTHNRLCYKKNKQSIKVHILIKILIHKVLKRK